MTKDERIYVSALQKAVKTQNCFLIAQWLKIDVAGENQSVRSKCRRMVIDYLVSNLTTDKLAEKLLEMLTS